MREKLSNLSFSLRNPFLLFHKMKKSVAAVAAAAAGKSIYIKPTEKAKEKWKFVKRN